MVVPDKVLNLSVDGINSSTATLLWDAVPPPNPALVFYVIDRKLEGVVGLQSIVAGSGYTIPPVVTVTGGGGNGAIFTSVLLGDSVELVLVSHGNGYTSVPIITIGPPQSGNDPASAEAFVSDNTFQTFGNVGPTITTFTDSTLFPRNNPSYQVFGFNGTGAGDFSDSASTTIAISEAQAIKEILFNNWVLTGELSKVVINNMTEPVHFLDRDQVPGNKNVKMVTVQKINALGNQNIVEHPKFFEQSETFEITCFLQVTDSSEDAFSIMIDLMQQMTSEVSRILKTRFSPSVTGEFFRSTIGWTKDDTFINDDPELTRTLQFTLTKIKSTSPEVFLGHRGVLLFDFSQSTGDSLPTADYLYTQVERVQILQGFRNIPYITTDSPTTIGIPIYYRGGFSGRFTCTMDLKKSDIAPTTLNSLSQIFLPQANGELGTASFFHNTPNTETPSTSLTESFFVNITNVEKIAENEQLIKFKISGNLTEPTTFSFTGGMLYEDQEALKMGYESDADVKDEMGYQ